MPFLEWRWVKLILTVTLRATQHQGRKDVKHLVQHSQCPPASVDLSLFTLLFGCPPGQGHLCFCSAHWLSMATASIVCSSRRPSCWGAAPSSKATWDYICKAGSRRKARTVLSITTTLPYSYFAMTWCIIYMQYTGILRHSPLPDSGLYWHWVCALVVH